MPPMAHREPGIAAAVLADERVTVGTIPDTIHVHPAMLDIAWRIAGPDRFSIVTDAMAALGMPHGSFRLADREVTVDDTGPRLPDGLLAGSILRLDAGVRNLAAATGRGVETALAAATTVPARLLGLSDRGRIAPGARADLTILTRDFDAVGTIVAGESRVGGPAARPRGAGVGLRDEILEQPEVATRFLRDGLPQVRRIADALDGRELDVVLIAARGTSDHAAIYAQYLFGALHRLPVALATPALVSLYGVAPRLERALVIGISQSGRSPDVVGVIDCRTRAGRPDHGHHQRPGIARWRRAAEHVIDIGAGPERATAATKTYTTQLLAVAMLAAALARRPTRARRLTARRARGLDGCPARCAAALAGEARGGRGRRDRAAPRPVHRARPRLRVRHGARMGAQAQGAGPGGRRPVLRGRLPARPAGARRARLPHPGGGADGRHAGGHGRAAAPPARRARGRPRGRLRRSRDPRRRRASLPTPSGLPEWLMPIVSIVPGTAVRVAPDACPRPGPRAPRWISKVTETR